MPPALRVLWSLDMPVGRRTYLMSGLLLAFLKYAGDVVIVWLGAGRLWTPFDYLLASWSLLTQRMPGAESWVLPALAIWTLPFIWMGITLSIRRAADAGFSPWSGLWFFVPLLNYAMMVTLCCMPSRRGVEPAAPARQDTSFLVAALTAAGAGAGIGLAMTAISVGIFHAYGAVLFFVTPFVMAIATAAIFNRAYPGSSSETYQVTALMFAIVLGAMLVLATEGLVCLMMAAPLAAVVAAMGTAVGRWLAGIRTADPPTTLFGLLALPVALALEPAPAVRVVHEVRSAIEISAPPMDVWREVIAFSPIPAPSDPIFRAGIAYPTDARIEGEGVGAVRYCVFSTGAFVEPITAWEPGRRLAFDVASSPPPLRELSLYRHVTPPHLDGYLKSRRGEFRLIALPGGGTRLEGSTWYEIGMAPEGYWQLFSDALIGRIHRRVLTHIKAEAEQR